MTRMTVKTRCLYVIGAAAAVVAPAGLGLLQGPRLRAQAPQASAAGPAFEVASIKPNNSGDGRVMMGMQPGGRFTATNITLRLLIRNAYQLQDFQIVGGPSWIGSEHYDIVAKGEDGLPPEPPSLDRTGPNRIQLMIRALLAERFQLTVHNETRELPIYALVLARSDGKLGPQLQKSEVDCNAVFAAARGRGGMPPPPGPPQQGERPSCGMRIGMGNLAMGGTPLSQFVNSLAMFTGRTVQDKTGLTGNYDVTLTWTPDQMPQRPPGAPEPPPIDPNGPSIFTAVQEQLGLKLESQKGPVAVLVIDRVERPKEN
jgi:bla regulator protein blaR1